MPDVILMEVVMPKMDGIEATKMIMSKYSTIKIIAHTQYDDDDNIIEMYRHGVRSFIGKSGDFSELLRAIRVVYEGGSYLTDHTLAIFKKFLHPSDTTESNKLRANLNLVQEDYSKSACQWRNIRRSLSDFEFILLGLLSQGKSSAEIGEILCKSHRTIEKSREKLYKKFGVGNKEQLILEASRQKII